MNLTLMAGCCVATALMLCAGVVRGQTARTTLRGDDVVFMYAANPEVYREYGATFLAWGGADTMESVRMHHEAGVHATGSMWCLTAGAKNLHDNPDLRDAVAKDIEGKPIAVPWLFDHVHEGTPCWFGCTNHPAFRAHVRGEVARVMAGGADGLHVDDHLGVVAPSSWGGGCFCDYCMTAFTEYLKQNQTPELHREAGVESFEGFDYRDLVRKHATTREQYLKVQSQIPLRGEFVNMQLNRAAENVRQLGELAAEIVGHPVTLSANTGLPSMDHVVVTPFLTHLVCEVDHHVDEGGAGLLNAVLAYRMAEAIQRPMASTAAGYDWAKIKQRGAVNQVKMWIGLSYACGQRLMVPHHQWCFTKELGTHWYDGPAEQFAPPYRFVRAHPELFAQTSTVGPLAPPGDLPRQFDTAAKRQALKMALEQGAPKPMLAGERAWVFPRLSADGEGIVHVINLDYDAATDTVRPQKDLRVTLPKGLYSRTFGQVEAYAYDTEPVRLDLRTSPDGLEVTIPELRVWTVLRLR
jgi:hypothetical protein